MSEKNFGTEISAPLVGNIFREFSFQPDPPLYERVDDIKAIASDLARSMTEAIEQKNGDKLNDIDRKKFLDLLTKETEKIVTNTAKDIKKSIDKTYERNGIPKETDLAEATLKNPKLMEEILKDQPAKASDRVNALLEKEERKLEKQINKKDNPLDNLSTQKQSPLERVNEFIKNASQKLEEFGSSMKESLLKNDFVKNAGQRFGNIMKGSLFKKETKSDEKTTEFSNIETPEPKQATISSTIQPATPIIETAGPTPMSATLISDAPKSMTPMSAATLSNIETPEPKQATISSTIQPATPIIETAGPTPMSATLISDTPKSMTPHIESSSSNPPMFQLDDKIKEEVRGAAIKGVEIDNSQRNDKIKPSVGASSKVEESARTR